MTKLREMTRKYAAEVGQLCDKQERHPDFEDVEAAYEAGFRAAIELAAQIGDGFKPGHLEGWSVGDKIRSALGGDDNA